MRLPWVLLGGDVGQRSSILPEIHASGRMNIAWLAEFPYGVTSMADGAETALTVGL